MDIKYNKSPLNQVIVRVDYLNPMEEFGLAIPNNLSSTIEKIFPVVQPRKILKKKLQIRDEEIEEETEGQENEWLCYNKDRTKLLTLSKSHFVIEYKKYEGFEVLQDELVQILNSLNKTKEIQARRLGLRYINYVQLSKGSPFTWRGYLNPKLLSIFDIPDTKENITRALHSLELAYEDFNLRFQYGMHNPDFPSPIKKKIFILDFDAYYESFLKNEDIVSYIPQFHEKIQLLFEKSILDKYRGILNG